MIFTLSNACLSTILPDHDFLTSVQFYLCAWWAQTWIENEEEVSDTIDVPTDGSIVTFAGELPHGTEVTLTETALEGSAAFIWDDPAWAAEGLVVNEDGSATITIGAAQEIAVALTNHAVESLGTLQIDKTLSGDGASGVPAGTTFPVTASWTNLLGEEQQVELELTVGETAVLENLPLGTEITLTEGDASSLRDVEWVAATWSSDAENVTISGEGTEVVVTITGDAGTSASVVLNNEYEKLPDLVATGIPGITIGVTVLALGLIAAGILFAVRSRRTGRRTA